MKLTSTYFCTLFIVLLFSSVGSLKSSAQTNPGINDVFRPDELATVWLVMSDNDKTQLLDPQNIHDNTYRSTTFRFANSVIDITLNKPVGVRLRGNTSRNNPKKSFKIKFKEFDGDKFVGLKKFNLKANNNDPSQLREHISLQLYREAGVAAARSHYTKVFLNGEYMGLYLNVEQIDDEFLDSRYDTEDGNLYKCAWGATLESNNDFYNDDLYELETQKKANDRSKLEHLATVLEHSTDNEFAEKITEVFNVENYLKQLAIETVIGHWDGYSYNQNNFYLFENPTTQKIEFIPYDLDNTFGIDWLSVDWGRRNIENWFHPSQARPLTKRILHVTEFHEKYLAEIRTLINEAFNEDKLFPIFETKKELLSPAIKSDNYYPLTFGFTHNNFLQSFDQSVANHAPYGLKNYVEMREQKCREQLPKINLSTDELSASTLQVYPSLNKGERIFVKTRSELSTNQKISVYHLLGMHIDFTISNSQNVCTLNFRKKLAPGTYIVKSGSNSRKFIVRH